MFLIKWFKYNYELNKKFRHDIATKKSCLGIIRQKITRMILIGQLEINFKNI